VPRRPARAVACPNQMPARKVKTLCSTKILTYVAETIFVLVLTSRRRCTRSPLASTVHLCKIPDSSAVGRAVSLLFDVIHVFVPVMKGSPT